jgi:hypothetical protein
MNFYVHLPKAGYQNLHHGFLAPGASMAPTKDSSHNKLYTSPIVRLDFHNQGRQSKFQ